MTDLSRRHDIDWLRVITIALLLIYHVAISFQSWGLMIGFITNKESWGNLWIPMSALNVWRIPLLFFVSGMGVYFALQKRNWKQLMGERTKRILLPFIFGMLIIVPVHLLLLQHYYSWPIRYKPGPSHLWFLGNIFIYTLVLLPLFMFLKRNKESKLAHILRKVIGYPLGLLIVMLFFVIEAVLVAPYPFEMYAMTIHGFILGLLAFCFGFLFMYTGKPFWDMLLKWRWIFIVGALVLYFYRLSEGLIGIPHYLMSIESCLWIFTVFAFGYRHLNFSNSTLRYLSQGAYPIYIVHMICIYAACYVILPLNLDVRLKFFIVLGMTFFGSFGIYELLIRRIKFIRPLFGMK